MSEGAKVDLPRLREILEREELLKQLARQNPQALLLEPHGIYDGALVGITDEPEDHWPRQERVYVAVYDEDRCVDAVMGWMDCDYHEAQEWLGFNTYGAWAGEGTPTFRSSTDGDDMKKSKYATHQGKNKRALNDHYPTPEKIVERMAREFLDVQINAIRLGNARPPIPVWEPCAGDGRIAEAIRSHGVEAIETDIATGNDFFDYDTPMSPILMTNPPFSKIREFIDHAFSIGVMSMALVCSERLWACKKGRAQFLKYRPSRFAMMDWREDYLGNGGSSDRALAVSIWEEPCAHICRYEVWGAGSDLYPRFDFQSFEKSPVGPF